MSFQDIFNSNFINRMSSVSRIDMIIALILSFLLGLFIYYIYQKTYSSVLFSASFGITLVALSMITTMLLLAISSNIVLSLGMVGALSIVRFRTAIKEPMDITFLFWSMVNGIVLAAGLLELAIFGSLMIGGLLVVMTHKRRVDTPYILIIETHKDSNKIDQLLKSKTKSYSLKSKNYKQDTTELTYDIRLAGNDSQFLDELNNDPEIGKVLLVSYNGEYMG